MTRVYQCHNFHHGFFCFPNFSNPRFHDLSDPLGHLISDLLPMFGKRRLQHF